MFSSRSCCTTTSAAITPLENKSESFEWEPISFRRQIIFQHVKPEKEQCDQCFLFRAFSCNERRVFLVPLMLRSILWVTSLDEQLPHFQGKSTWFAIVCNDRHRMRVAASQRRSRARWNTVATALFRTLRRRCSSSATSISRTTWEPRSLWEHWDSSPKNPRSREFLPKLALMWVTFTLTLREWVTFPTGFDAVAGVFAPDRQGQGTFYRIFDHLQRFPATTSRKTYGIDKETHAVNDYESFFIYTWIT